MKTKIYLDDANFIAGMTLKDVTEPEMGNMALHTCANPAAIIENRRKLAALLHCGLNDFVCCEQTHSSNFCKISASDRGCGAVDMETSIADTDAIYTYEPNLLLCCFTADCVPVIFYNNATGLIGTIHSGWKGTVKEITPKVLDHLTKEHCNPKDLNVFIGSALGQEKFQVDEDVYVMYKDLGYADDYIYWDENNKKYHIDNQLVVKRQCEIKGVDANRIVIDRTCTFLNPEGFSYRQDKDCGRHLGFIMKKSV